MLTFSPHHLIVLLSWTGHVAITVRINDKRETCESTGARGEDLKLNAMKLNKPQQKKVTYSLYMIGQKLMKGHRLDLHRDSFTLRWSIKCTYFVRQCRTVNSPQNNDNEVQPVPRISEVSVRVKNKST